MRHRHASGLKARLTECIAALIGSAPLEVCGVGSELAVKSQATWPWILRYATERYFFVLANCGHVRRCAVPAGCLAFVQQLIRPLDEFFGSHATAGQCGS